MLPALRREIHNAVQVRGVSALQIFAAPSGYAEIRKSDRT